ncbi:Fructokinase [uncultured Desulfobacterium sp.]|uniref:Fructokinase n=1 Tax=uncultured Desulfobacterium sp. TaxID=201089 RepID=A0A445N3Z8_9BACT|nr:Fructokinase [uncultured Desulfobacterium sp.]
MGDNIYRIGIDLGGTKTEAIVLGQDDCQLHRERRSTPEGNTYQRILVSVLDLIDDAYKKIPVGEGYSVGIGIPGSIDYDTGLVHNANTTCLIGRPFKNDLEDSLGRKIAMENDANCFTLAECRHGAAKGYGLVFGVIMGTGCGGGICINGNVWRGGHGIAGEWGHFSVDPNGAPCYCGNKGCIETKISGSGVESAFFKLYGRRLKMHEIVQNFRNGDPECRETFLMFMDDFGRSLGGLISILDPDAVVLGGGLSNINELYTFGIDKVRQYAFHRQIRTPILKNSLGDSAGVFGAAWIGK